MILTLEQQAIIDSMCSNDSNNKIVSVNSISGAGKSFTSKAVVEALKPKQGFYTAFNKAIVEDTAAKLGGLIDARTIHSLAYKYVKPSKVRELSYLDLDNNNLDFDDKKQILKGIDGFYRSQYINVEDYLVQNVSTCYHDDVLKYIDMMYTGHLPPSFNYLLKCFHLMLIDNDATLDLDLLILDEVQDTSGVMLEIFKLANSKKKLMLGDSFQNIYGFLDTVNGFNLLKDNTIPFRLTKSFRCNSEIAQEVELYGKEYLTKDFIFQGTDNPITSQGITYLSRTNAHLIWIMYKLIEEGKYFYCHKNVKDIFTLPFSILAATNNKPIFTHEYKFLNKEKERWDNTRPREHTSFLSHLLSLELPELTSAAKTLLKLRGVNLYDLQKKILARPQNKDIQLSTIHAYKGLENDTVVLESNVQSTWEASVGEANERFEEKLKDDTLQVLQQQNKSLIDIIDDYEPTRQECNLYYVALSRAKHNLIKKDRYEG